ncbi:MAG: hypothetical protein R3275_07055 [Saprospiraceae bacterium]|nr:hypothetical protein [Saprospiraceae bacterium]
MLFRLFTIPLILTLSFMTANCQDDWEFTFGISSEFGFNLKSKSFFNISVAMGIKRYVLTGDHDWNDEGSEHFAGELGRHIFFAYQPSINLYSHGLGDNVLDGQKRVEIDFVNSLMMNVGQPNHGIAVRQQLLTPFNSFTAKAVYDDFTNSFAFGTNFIINNHNRNQIIGFLNLNIARILRLGYYNDGVPFGRFGIADRYDRWWTGGGFGEIYLNQGLVNNQAYFTNSVISYQFDRFTGDVQDAYKVSNIFGFRYIPDADRIESYYNNSRNKFAFQFLNDGLEFSAQWMGHISDDIQNFIHRTMKLPYHLTYAQRYPVFGIKHAFTQNIQL